MWAGSLRSACRWIQAAHLWAAGTGYDAAGPQGIAAALGVLTAIVAFHELGHFTAARVQGIHVSKFAIGFGPVVWKYQVHLLPHPRCRTEHASQDRGCAFPPLHILRPVPPLQETLQLCELGLAWGCCHARRYKPLRLGCGAGSSRPVTPRCAGSGWFPLPALEADGVLQPCCGLALVGAAQWAAVQCSLQVVSRLLWGGGGRRPLMTAATSLGPSWVAGVCGGQLTHKSGPARTAVRLVTGDWSSAHVAGGGGIQPAGNSAGGIRGVSGR